MTLPRQDVLFTTGTHRGPFDCGLAIAISDSELMNGNPQSEIRNPKSNRFSVYFALVNKVLEAELRATGLCYNLGVFHKTPAGPQG
ncbi:MAG: hypothetical protein DMG10_12715 [Acidobacteria bacterium]|nr:MAG: hypothetical protein DMG10_12715 [Acidobacteriota bacterium]